MFTLLFALPFALCATTHALSDNHDYRQVHSYSPNTTFDKRDGWDSVLVSDLPYKYSNTSPAPTTLSMPAAHRNDTRRHYRFGRSKKQQKASAKPKTKAAAAGGKLGGIIDGALKGIGEATSVVITWYTGHDLLNPSCWSNGNWHPTDDSYACALTLEGWTTRPKCFSFLELCNGPSKCIFVRVVDTCAGCKKGSKHVDLTKAAFTKLAPLDQGLLNVNMRLSTAPKTWNTALWGPKN